MSIELTVAVASYPYTEYLRDGTVGIDGVTLRFVEIDGPITTAFRRMARTQEFDISEFGITTCFSAIEKGLPLTAIPVFLTRQLDHNIMFYNAASSIRDPLGLVGKRVGIRPYTIAGGVWARAILSEIYGLDLDGVNWIVADEEHVLDCMKPPNVTQIPGANLGEMLVSGELDAGIGIYRGDSDRVSALFPDLASAAERWMSAMGFLPIHHTVVLRDEVFNSSPDLAQAVYQAFVQSKQLYLERRMDDSDTGRRLENDTPAVLGGEQAMHGISPNRDALATLVRIADEQHFSPGSLSIEELFYPGSSAW